MNRPLVTLVAVVAVTLVIRAWWRGGAEQRAQAAEAAAKLREGVLSRAMLSGLPPVAPGTVRGAVMDWNLGGGLATLVAIEDGTVSLYLNPGGGIIGAGTHANVAQAATVFRDAALRRRDAFKATDSFPPPGKDAMIFYLLTDSATLTSGEVSVADLQRGDHPLASLGKTSQDLLTAVRRAK
jgi:hypothetical protein